MSGNTFFVWDFHALTDTQDMVVGSYEEATTSFEKLRNTATEQVSESIIALAKRMDDEALSQDYSNDFVDTYLNTLNHVNDQPAKLAIEMPTPDTAHGEALDVFRPLCKELGLVFYDSRGAVFYPDGSIYPPNVAAYIEKREAEQKQATQGADIYNPDAELPEKRADFTSIIEPFISDCFKKLGYQTKGQEKEVRADDCLEFIKKASFGNLNLIVAIDGTLECYTIETTCWLSATLFNDVFIEIYPNKKSLVSDVFLKSISVSRTYISNDQEEIESKLIPELIQGLTYLASLNNYNDLFEHYHSRVDLGWNIDQLIILAKLAGREDYDDLIKQYEQLLVDMVNLGVKERIESIWDKLLMTLEQVEPIV